ncbi:MAG TPA: hypothetical protein VFH15_05730 [Pyrinomonadaceae bacterium]|nr:hypothetical protein [Pyrinomonadaceae bacterium]
MLRLKPPLIGLMLGCFLIGFAATAGAQNTAGDEWKRYELGKGNFSVLLPEQPKEQFTPSPADAAVPIDIYSYAVVLKEGSYVAQYCLLGEVALNWAEATIDSFYDGVWQGAADGFDREMAGANLSFRAKVVDTREITFSGHKGREVIFTIGPLNGRMRITLVGRQAFGASVLGTDNLSIADRQRFMDSFVVTPKPIPVVIKAA